jgi:hypothetical protein
MAYCLFKWRDKTNSNPEKDARGCWKKGYLVEVRDDSAPLAAQEKWPEFVVVRIPEMTKAELEPYTERFMDTTDPDNPILLRRRDWKFDFDDVNIPKQVMDLIASGKEITITRAQLNAFIKRIT